MSTPVSGAAPASKSANAPTATPAAENECVTARVCSRIASDDMPIGSRPAIELTSRRMKPGSASNAL